MKNFKPSWVAHHPLRRIRFELGYPIHRLVGFSAPSARFSQQCSTVDSKEPKIDQSIVRNPLGVQLIPRSIHQQIFPGKPLPPPCERVVCLSKEHLSRHALAQASSDPIESPTFQLPPLQGETIDQHFANLGVDRSEPYLSTAKAFSLVSLPAVPTNWSRLPGWTIYHSDGSFEAIEHPPENEQVLVFDVETLPARTQCGVMATAVSHSSWYSWLSPWLVGKTDQPDQLIHMPSSLPRLLIGHHVGFDRARIQQEYSLQSTSTRFLDTMSLHVATFGISNPQRPAYLSIKKQLTSSSKRSDKFQSTGSNDVLNELVATDDTNSQKPNSWADIASMNSLDEVAKLHCGIQLDKSIRHAFLEWDKSQIVSHLPQLLEYCARDVVATHAVFCKLLPIFLKQCPHPVSFAGMLHMGNPFLPVDESWKTFLERSESAFLTKSTTVKASLHRLAEATRKLMFVKDPKTGRPIYEDDHWLKQLDWTPKKARWTSFRTIQDGTDSDPSPNDHGKPSVPAWYADLRRASPSDPFPITLDSPLCALLFRVKFRGHPVIWSRKLGWMFGGILEPNADPSTISKDEVHRCDIPHHVELFEREHVFQIPSTTAQSTKRVRTLLSRAHSKLFESGVFSSPYQEARLACQVPKKSPEITPSNEAIYYRLMELAEEAKSLNPLDAKLDPWLRQLDWTLVNEEIDFKLEISRGYADVLAESDSLSLKKRSRKLEIPEEDKVWPSWYWLLTRRGINNINLTTKSQMAPLLLRLSFCGFPLFRSKQHGWVFRVPLNELAQPHLTRTPLSFNVERDPMFVNDQGEAVYFKVPHPEGEAENVGNPLSKAFDKAFENEVLCANPLRIDHSSASSLSEPAHEVLKAGDSQALADDARQALSMNLQCSYWLNASQRIKDQMVVWETSPTQPSGRRLGLILPQVTVMGTVTRRATEKTWLAAANAKKNKIGTELKSMVRAPPGYSIVGADVDSEELWISSVMGDAQFGMHGATAIGWMTLEGTKTAGTDLHSKTASILGISRNDAKVFNYSRIYGAGIAHAVQLLMKADPTASKEEATKLAKQLYASTKGLKNYRADIFGSRFWYGGTESYLFNKLEQIALADYPETPALECGITRALRKNHLPNAGEGPDYMTSRINWAVQSSGVDYLHLLIVAMEYLIDRYGIHARYMISVHDEIRYLSAWEDRYRCALALQIANLWTRCQFAFKLEMDDLPQSCAWFSSVDVDHVLRKEVDLPCVTPSNPDPISPGESLDIHNLLKVTPMGLGEPLKPLNTIYCSPENSEHQFRGLNPPFLKHRSTNLEWLAAQSCQDPADVRKHWNRARRQLQAKSPHPVSSHENVHDRSLRFHPATKNAAKLPEQIPLANPDPTTESHHSSPCATPSSARSDRSMKESRFRLDYDPDLSAWKVFDAVRLADNNRSDM